MNIRSAWRPVAAPFLGESEHRVLWRNFVALGNPYGRGDRGVSVLLRIGYLFGPRSFPASILIGPPSPFDLQY